MSIILSPNYYCPKKFIIINILIIFQELRQQLMQIKKYLTSCKVAVEEQLLWQYSDKLHFLETEDNYSLQDLLELRSGVLVKYLNNIKDRLIKHIKSDCQVSTF